MDVRCQHCGEPCDVYHLYHDMEPEYREMFKAGTGCDACQGRQSERRDDEYMEKVRLLSELMGDDIDGLACMTEDLDLWEG